MKNRLGMMMHGHHHADVTQITRYCWYLVSQMTYLWPFITPSQDIFIMISPPACSCSTLKTLDAVQPSLTPTQDTLFLSHLLLPVYTLSLLLLTMLLFVRYLFVLLLLILLNLCFFSYWGLLLVFLLVCCKTLYYFVLFVNDTPFFAKIKKKWHIYDTQAKS